MFYHLIILLIVAILSTTQEANCQTSVIIYKKNGKHITYNSPKGNVNIAKYKNHWGIGVNTMPPIRIDKTTGSLKVYTGDSLIFAYGKNTTNNLNNFVEKTLNTVEKVENYILYKNSIARSINTAIAIRTFKKERKEIVRKNKLAHAVKYVTDANKETAKLMEKTRRGQLNNYLRD